MGKIASFLGGYSDSLVAAVALWPFASFALTLPILAYLYHRDGRLRFGSAAAAYLTVLYVLGLGCFTLYPLPSGTSGPGITYGVPWQLDPLAFVGDLAREGLSAVPQIAFNVVFFVPLGFIAGRLFGWKFLPTLATGLAASLLIEVAQGTGLFGVYPYAYRTADVDDLLWNALGAAAGWLLARLLGRVLPPGEEVDDGFATRSPGFVQRAVALWLDMTLLMVAWSVLCSLADLAGGAFVPLNQDATATLAALLLVVLFVLVEGVVPWMRDGRTPGGAFVRMTFETRERTRGRRLVFYAVRMLVLGATMAAPVMVVPPLALFYLVKRCMPYDLMR